MTFADLSSWGMLPNVKERFMMCVRGMDNWSAPSTKNVAGIESRPVALFEFSFYSVVLTLFLSDCFECEC